MSDYSHVTLVVDPHYGARAMTKAEIGPLWVIDSPANTPVIKAIWSQGISKFSDSPTCFRDYQDKEKSAAIAIGTLHDHHPEWKTFEVIGVEPRPGILDAFAECASGTHKLTSEGFIFERDC
jgi:hypothetical protein